MLHSQEITTYLSLDLTQFYKNYHLKLFRSELEKKENIEHISVQPVLDLINAGKEKEGIDLLQQTLLNEPKNYFAHTLIGFCTKNIDHYKMALKIKPDFSLANYYLGSHFATLSYRSAYAGVAYTAHRLDEKQAIEYLEIAAQQKHPLAVYELGHVKYGVVLEEPFSEYDCPERMKNASLLCDAKNEAAYLGYFVAQMEYFQAFHSPLYSVAAQKDAYDFLTRTAEQGHPEAQFKLAKSYQTGVVNENKTIIIKRNLQQAVFWYSSLVQQNINYLAYEVSALLNTASIYEDETFENRNYLKALEYYQKTKEKIDHFFEDKQFARIFTFRSKTFIEEQYYSKANSLHRFRNCYTETPLSEVLTKCQERIEVLKRIGPVYNACLILNQYNSMLNNSIVGLIAEYSLDNTPVKLIG